VIDDAVDVCLAQSILRGEFTHADAAGTEATKLDYIEGRQFRGDDILAPISRTMPDAIRLILPGSAPGEIVESVVERIAVEVAAFHSRWARAAENLKHNSMDVLAMDDAVAMQRDAGVSLPGPASILASPTQRMPDVSEQVLPIRPLQTTAFHPAIRPDAIARESGDVATLGGRAILVRSHGVIPPRGLRYGESGRVEGDTPRFGPHHYNN
jgi:hypothetical protein